MKQYTDGNTHNPDYVYIKDGIIYTSQSLETEYGSDRFEFEMCTIASTLKDMAQRFYDETRLLKEELARINQRPKRPTLKPSIIATKDKPYRQLKKKRTQQKNPDKSKLTITQSITLKPKQTIPEGSRFKGYKKYYVQELELKCHCIVYQRERWKTPNGTEVLGELPEHVKKHHFGSKLRQFILYQYFHNHVTQPLLLNQLRELGLSISSGQLSNLLTKNNREFSNEKETLLSTALRNSEYIQVDDTGSRHRGKNGYCTQFGNDQFTYFKTAENKSKNNFLTVLQGKEPGFRLNQTAYDYLARLKSFSNWSLSCLEIDMKYNQSQRLFSSKNELLNYLNCQPYTKGSYKALIEAAMIGYLTEDIFQSGLIILSDEAKQFYINSNAACWVHVERKLTKVIPENDKQARLKEKKLNQFWDLYDTLKVHLAKGKISPQQSFNFKKRFDNLCKKIIKFKAFNVELEHIHTMKNELLKCLINYKIPLHNNMSESDIREYVKRRNISGCTKSEDGRDAVDTFLSLKKTCQRHQISFWLYLQDRLQKLDKLPQLSDFIINSP